MKPKFDTCIECNEPRWLANNSKKLCKYHNERRKQADKKAKGKKPYQYVRKVTGERAVFEQIWKEREHKCDHCGKPLGEARVHYFAHIRSKGSAPHLRLDPTNIRILCFDFTNFGQGCHYLFDHGTKDQFEARKDKYNH